MKIVSNERANYRGIDFCYDIFEDGSNNLAERIAKLEELYADRLR